VIRRSHDADEAEQGFTLVELLIVTAVLPLVMGAIAVGLISVFSLQNSVSNRLSDSGDAQTLSATFVKDVQGASLLTTDPTSTSPAPCETTTESANANVVQLLGLESGTGAGTTEYSYLKEPNGSIAPQSTDNLVRNVCLSPSTTPVSTSVVSRDIPTTQAALAIVQSGTSNPANGWISTSGVTSVKFQTTEQGSTYPYTLVALPRATTNSNQQSTVTTPTTSCGFATPGSGTYAANLCFVDFSPYGLAQQGACATGSEFITAGITNTPYTLQFCMSVSGGAVKPAAFPTYYDPPVSEAFLGNNGFYTGVPGNPALYQSTEGTTSVVSITNIAVLDSQGTSAIGWDLAVGDAESTDPGESMTWNTGTSGPVLGLIPNSLLSPVGNACGSVAPLVNTTDLTGLGTSKVECAAPSTQAGEKTGTVMLEALAPSSLTVTMVGAGKEAMFLGVLLPS
jgi:prepilin-type N-terminal cleavage/methylation domain-containing protein